VPNGYQPQPVNQSGPPNYGAPPGWTPATVPGGQPATPWKPNSAEPSEAEAGKRSFDNDPDNRT
jgi:cell division protease FtsH